MTIQTSFALPGVYILRMVKAHQSTTVYIGH